MSDDPKQLNWSERLTLIKHFNPSDKQAMDVFGVTSEELAAAREMQEAGTFTSSADIDVEQYVKFFDVPPQTEKSSTAESFKKPSPTENPQTASEKQKQPKKRGRRGDKIQKAFTAIPNNPTSAEEFAKQHGVSLAVLRQSKRFDKSPHLGTVKVKKDKESKTLMVWREQE